jgi:hypothetical protein
MRRRMFTARYGFDSSLKCFVFFLQVYVADLSVLQTLIVLEIDGVNGSNVYTH